MGIRSQVLNFCNFFSKIWIGSGHALQVSENMHRVRTYAPEFRIFIIYFSNIWSVSRYTFPSFEFGSVRVYVPEFGIFVISFRKFAQGPDIYYRVLNIPNFYLVNLDRIRAYALEFQIFIISFSKIWLGSGHTLPSSVFLQFYFQKFG